MQIKLEKEIKLIDCYTGLIIDLAQIPEYFKCMTVDSVDPIALNISVINLSAIDGEISFKLQAQSLPTEEDKIIYCAFDPKNNFQTITFIPHPSSWHYIQISPVTGNASQIADCESYLRIDYEEEVNNHTVLDLMRDDKGRFFSFDYGLPTTDLADVTSIINITSSELKTIRFKVNQFLDIGGTLSIEASLLMSLKYYMGYKREFKKGSLLAFSEDNQFIRAVICMDNGYSSLPLETGHCKYNDQVKPALFILNSTDSESIYDKVIIPYPESGTWYLTLRLFCDQVVCPCPTSDNGTKYYVDPLIGEKAIDADSGVSLNNTRAGTSDCNASVVLVISSSSCVGGRCSNHGTCLLNTFAGLVMSFCSCSAGYGSKYSLNCFSTFYHLLRLKYFFVIITSCK